MTDDPRDDARLTAEGDLLAAALRSTPPREMLAGEGLRAAVGRYAAAARAAGLPPERLVVQVKALVRAAAAPGAGSWFHTVVADRVIVWSIEAYYGLPATDG